MQQQTSLLFYRFRYFFSGITLIAVLLVLSASIAAVGSGSMLDARTGASVKPVDTSTSYNPNAVVTGGYALMNGLQRVTLATGTTLYGGCRSVTIVTARSGRSVAHGSAVAVHGTWNGIAFVGRGIGNATASTLRAMGTGALFVVRIPGKIVGSVTHVRTVSAIIRPADDTSVPIISSETSEAALAHFNAEQRQQIANLQAAQLVANRNLGGLAIAGDPAHGGYPAKWDAPVPQDSLVDSWGMYSRECVSYAAWKVYQTYGNMPYWGGVGNANQWVGDAKAAGIPTGPTPRVHSVAISMNGYYGHAMWVEKVSGDMIYVSQYNYDLHGHYSEMWVSGSSFTYIYFK